MNWRQNALCRGEDPDLFFPIGGGNSGPTLMQTAEAKAVCRRCPVARQCLEWALRGHVRWSGVSTATRRSRFEAMR
ncbi:WhiB family transcriptional regulator [Streptomyces wuyuanensis]|uniref:WhiB family transcriptional regulator n=1 Tax=Streptomyces wuyuanensis TaxID=1196353 RepID=UPI000B812118|nr:WhiB family transcriptional regulator [Streptomyces wuyuanensis]